MGFEHTLKVDIATVRRAESALTAFGRWALSTDPDAADKLWGICEFHIYEDVDEEVVTNTFGTDPVRVRDYFDEDEWPAPGEGLIHWPELPFFHLVTPEARGALYRISEEFDALEVWAVIMRAGEAADTRAMETLRRVFGDLEIGKYGGSRD